MTLPTKFSLASQLPGEEQFLDAVVANLADDLPKLIYADWLTEQRDDRADFLRAYVAAVRSGSALPKPASTRDRWEELIGYHLDRRIRTIGVVDQRDAIMRMAEPAIAIELEGCDEDDIPAGGTKFGGLPHLPADMDWPRCEGGPLAFHAQFDLDDLARTVAGCRLPSEGLLSLFMWHDLRQDRYGDRKTRGFSGGLRILFTPIDSQLDLVEPPDDLVKNSGAPISTSRATLIDMLDTPGPGHPLLPVPLNDDGTSNSLPYGLRSEGMWESPHQMFGFAHPPHVDRDLIPGPDWELLLKLSCDAQFNWGDGHPLFWYIRTEDLVARRFDQTVAYDG